MTPEAIAPSSHLFSPDRPRNRIEEDQLGRQGFARSLWHALRNHDTNEAIVLSVEAPWGEGKTSLVNMVQDLEATEVKAGECDGRLLFVHFNPWEWTAQNQVATAFFTELVRHIDEAQELGIDKSNLGPITKAVTVLRKVLGLGAVIAKATGTAAAQVDPDAAFTAAAVGESLEKLTTLAETTENATRSAEQHHSPSLQTVKADVRKNFELFRTKTNRNIVVFIDDIDRLSGDEIRQVLQLVKVNADFPGLIFVLLFDRKYVERRLRRHFGSDSAAFLDKIVQVELRLPKASEDQLYVGLRREIASLLEKRPSYKDIFEEVRLKKYFDIWLRHHLINPRKYGRLLSSWAFKLDVFRTTAAEVNPVDLLILEGLSLYEMDVYSALSKGYNDLFAHRILSAAEILFDDVDHKDRKPSARMQAITRTAMRTNGQVTT
ncbi:MAG: P-loop NTPase fold protein [Verrucomicrobiota bacterium]|jgi:predicted KAP-like P-loop ATPase